MPGGGGRGSLLTCAECGATPGDGTSIGVRDLQYFGSNCDNCGDPAHGNTEYCPCNLKLILQGSQFPLDYKFFLPKWHFRQAYSFSPVMLWRRLFSACTQQQFFKPKALLFTWKTCNWTVQNNAQNALKVAILRYKIKNFLGRGTALSPDPSPSGEGDTSSLQTTPSPRRLRRLDCQYLFSLF